MTRPRLRQQGHRVGRNRVLRLMRLHGLLAPQRAGHRHGDPAHAGTITTAAPNVLWGTDATRFHTAQEGWCWWFGAIDHASADIVGWHVAKIGDRWAALEPVHQGMRHAYGAFGQDVARGLALRSDWGPQYAADAFRNELAWLGITHTPSFVGEPQCNGVIERFIRTLKEQCLWLHRFETLAEAPGNHRGLHPTLQRGVDHRTARLSDPGHRPTGAGSGGLTKATACPRNRVATPSAYAPPGASDARLHLNLPTPSGSCTFTVSFRICFEWVGTCSGRFLIGCCEHDHSPCGPR